MKPYKPQSKPLPALPCSVESAWVEQAFTEARLENKAVQVSDSYKVKGQPLTVKTKRFLSGN